VTGLSCLATILNPNGLGAWLYPFTLMRHQGMLDLVAEWHSPNFHLTAMRPYELLLLLAVGAAGLSRARRAPADLLLLVALIHASLVSLRHMPVFTLVAAPLAAEYLAATLAEAAAWLQSRRSARARRAAASGPTRSGWSTTLALVLAAAAIVAGMLGEWQRIPAGGWFDYCAMMDHFPKRACDFLARQNWDARLFNKYNWGGYCVWRLYPKYQVFIDNRAEVFFDTSFDDYKSISRCRDGWPKLLDKWSIDTVLMKRRDLVAQLLARTAGWQVAYQDEQAIVLHRDRSPSGQRPGGQEAGVNDGALRPASASLEPAEDSPDLH
jgi:hypothetical protein